MDSILENIGVEDKRYRLTVVVRDSQGSYKCDAYSISYQKDQEAWLLIDHVKGLQATLPNKDPICCVGVYEIHDGEGIYRVT